jgi:hypothetical protein
MKKQPTTNNQQPTSNIQHPMGEHPLHWMFDVGCWMLGVPIFIAG